MPTPIRLCKATLAVYRKFASDPLLDMATETWDAFPQVDQILYDWRSRTVSFLSNSDAVLAILTPQGCTTPQAKPGAPVRTRTRTTVI